MGDQHAVVGADLARQARKVHVFAVDRAGDVRVLSNNTPSERWAETMLHEFGHAVYFEGVGHDLPWLLRTMHLCLTEGIAMRCGRVKRDRRGNVSGETSWLARRIGQLPEGGEDQPTPWVHTDTLALIARDGLGLSPREVEPG